MIRTNINYEGRMRRTILSKTDLEKPRGITLDPFACYLFVTDWSSIKPGIIRSDLDGENVKVLFNGDFVTWPNGIAADYGSRRIYWVDAKRDYIASSDYDGKFLKYVLRGKQTPHPFALGVFKKYVYYDDWNLRKLIMVNKNDGSQSIDILPDVTGAMDLKIIAPYFRNKTNICNVNTTCEHLCIAKPFNSFRCFCPDGFVQTKSPDGNEVCSCPNGQEFTQTGACRPLQSNSTCSVDNFICDNGNCIPKYWKCDDDDDCGDGSDEKLCNDPNCKSTEFQCKSDGRCILDIWVCDHEKECLDGSDEDIKMCGALYPKCDNGENFLCKNFRCISHSQVCDHIDHCRDGSDEQDCAYHSTTFNTSCDAGHFWCKNGDCIQELWHCDGHYDCLDRSDEMNCSVRDCLSSYFYCAPSKSCMPNLYRCDGEEDCGDGSDEQNCPVILANVTTEASVTDSPFNTGSCAPNLFACKSGMCIPFSWHCDGNHDCRDGSDEHGCSGLRDKDKDISFKNKTDVNTSTNYCGPSKFFCYQSNHCIFGSYVCDGDQDCQEGEDEYNCQYNSNLKCTGSYFACLFVTGCVPTSKVCDGHADCTDGTDEMACTDSKVPIKPICLGFTCQSGECVEGNMRCNNVIDCFDKSDEENCFGKNYVVNDLRVLYETITSSSFTVVWKSPNSSLTFKYLPSYSVDSEHGTWYNTTWIDSTKYTFNNLHSDSTYSVSIYIKLVASSNDHFENQVYSPSDPIKVVTASVAPEPPYGFKAKETGFNKVHLEWLPVTALEEVIKGYKVYYSPPYPPASKVLGAHTLELELYGFFQVGVNYTFWVTTLTKSLESKESQKVTIEIGPATTIEDLHQHNITNSSAIIKWKAVPNRVDKWFIVYKCEEYFPIFSKNLTTSKTEALITKLSPGVNYQFMIYPIINNTILFDGVQQNMISIRTLGAQLPFVHFDYSVRGSVVHLWWSAAQHSPKWEYAVYVGYTERTLKLYARTKFTSIKLKNLYSCETYLVQVRVIEPNGLGPSRNDQKVQTLFDPTSPPRRLSYEPLSFKKTKYRISWNSSCYGSRENGTNNVGYIVSVNDTLLDREDRFRLVANDNLMHSIDLDIHYGAVYHIKVSTDHPQAMWSDVLVLRAPQLPKLVQPFARITENTHIVVMWKLVDYYPVDYQQHR